MNSPGSGVVVRPSLIVGGPQQPASFTCTTTTVWPPLLCSCGGGTVVGSHAVNCPLRAPVSIFAPGTWTPAIDPIAEAYARGFRDGVAAERLGKP